MYLNCKGNCKDLLFLEIWIQLMMLMKLTYEKERGVLAMTVLDHSDYNIEIEKLNYILNYLKDYNDSIITQKSRIDKEVDYGVRHYNSDNAEQFNELIINTTLQDSLNQKIKNLNKSLLKPYFARVDFNEDGDKALQKLYIGKMSLVRDEDHEPYHPL